ncbi:hypothetical protein EDD18DRAFT_306795 [Armillaria luteobubalina]|uniref:Secreted protein n=1 Tax=Armillaria luteobubalina TaxID=153913 RepID=A0AA39V3Y2_9AGAR|nr:hypothetical protein EDD18DRAFT_306795 [Armillaria luteobubalina]
MIISFTVLLLLFGLLNYSMAVLNGLSDSTKAYSKCSIGYSTTTDRFVALRLSMELDFSYFRAGIWTPNRFRSNILLVTMDKPKIQIASWTEPHAKGRRHMCPRLVQVSHRHRTSESNACLYHTCNTSGCQGVF